MKVVFSDKIGYFSVWVEEEIHSKTGPCYMVRSRWGGLQESDIFDTKIKQQALDVAFGMMRTMSGALMSYIE